MNIYKENKAISSSIASASQKYKSMFPFYLLLFYLFLEYGRPQHLLPFLTYLHLPALSLMLLAFIGVNTRKFKWKNKQTILFLFFLGLMVIHGPIAVNNYWTLKIFIAMVINLIAYLSLSNFTDKKENYNKLVDVWLAIHIFLAIIGIKNSGAGIGGFLGDENDFCMTVNMIIPFSFFLAVCASGKKRVYYILLTCLFIFVVLLSRSRGGFVGLCAMFLFCWLRTKKKMITGFFVVLLVGFAVAFAPTDYWDEVKSIRAEGASTGTGEQRVYEWKIGWHMFLDNPIMGVGQGNFPWEFKKYEFQVTGSDEPYYGRSVAGRVAHSLYFTLFPELGLIGAFLFFAIIYYSLKDLKITRKLCLQHEINNTDNQRERFYYLTIALEGSMVSYLVSGIFISILYYPNFYILVGFIMSLKKIVILNYNSPGTVTPA